MAMTPERKVDAALNARSACPIPPCWIGLGLFVPVFVRLRPALSLSVATEGAFVVAGADEVFFGLEMGLAAVVEATEGALAADAFSATMLPCTASSPLLCDLLEPECLVH